MAAMLLMSVCTFAQDNNTPLKGDVNEDGTVDVADLVSVMKIMKDAGGAVGEKMYYWYAGVNGGNAVTEANFIDVASKIAESQIPETGFVTAADQYVYFVMPETRYMSSLMDANGTAVDYDCTDAFGYHIYKTQEKYSGELKYDIAERFYYYYVGWTLPTIDNLDVIINETYPESSTDTTPHAAGKKTTSKSSFSLASVNLYYSTAKTNYYVLVPTGHAIYDTVFNTVMSSNTDAFTSQGNITVGNQIHTIYKSVNTTRNITSIEIK